MHTFTTALTKQQNCCNSVGSLITMIGKRNTKRTLAQNVDWKECWQTNPWILHEDISWAFIDGNDIMSVFDEQTLCNTIRIWNHWSLFSTNKMHEMNLTLEWNEMKFKSRSKSKSKIDHQISNRDKPCRSVLYTLEGLDCVMLDTWHRCIQPDLTGTCQGVETSTLRPKHVGSPRPRASKLLDQQKAGRPSPWVLAKCSIKEDQA